MPELPEVEVSRQGISPYMMNEVIEQIVVRDSRLRWPIPDTIQTLKGQRIENIRRRAKYLLIDTQIGSAILHLGMSGSLRVIPIGTPAQKHDHVDIHLSNGQMLRLNDPRRFGCLLFSEEPLFHDLLAKLGPEPLTEEFTGQWLYERSRGKTSAVKTFVMDNRNVVGVGNIYANESLFRSGISPTREAGKVSKARYIELASMIKQVLAAAIEQGGTTLKDFAQVDGTPGYFAQTLFVYGRGGKPCFKCDRELKEIRLGQRSTVYCTQCQR
ncbi:bifunctional DNA-formamidopyrimidine glycosylase/DNA-(apurinic or apyrimidinic site) lyase [Echinimonas agarilytica]|uniref:Formamidopyrimidine-DNA glycosylase n=1 Tax=Echinimonas agarilytica TaxID=1215918 RepID=A0AA42B8H3_9GAMM|nr:bifunctional DNA-formamidopyrimidine glycosylase/DNA-(apurinic or apyrimidinic site) lyase [Echinimonas agarilytica]MCM2680934.1 bifunctional DNA-formamidopyrimidine glycosylase/DNA-(apurinic or apyrimidinic site) lyase [Echinimonas agarilytica]